MEHGALHIGHAFCGLVPMADSLRDRKKRKKHCSFNRNRENEKGKEKMNKRAHY